MIVTKRALMFKIPGYGNQFTRGLASSWDDELKNDLLSATNGGTNYNDVNIGQVADRILSPSSQVGGVVDIAESWNQARYRFIIEVEEHSMASQLTRRRIITGWTQHDELTGAGQINPNSVFYINGTLGLTDSTIRTPQGFVTKTSITDNVSFLRSRYGQDTLSHSLRPCDVMQNVNVELVSQDVAGSMGGLNSYQLVNMSSAFTNGIKVNNRGNNITSSYLTKTLSSDYKLGLLADDDNYDDDSALCDVLGPSHTVASDETPLSSMASIRELSLQDNGFTEYGYITYRDLRAVFHNLDEEMQIIDMDTNRFNRSANPMGDSADWSDGSNEAITAYRVASTICSAMYQNMIGSINLKLTNYTMDGSNEVFVLGDTPPLPLTVKGAAEDDSWLQTAVDRLMAMLKYQVMPGITVNGLLRVDVQIYADALWDVVVDVSIENEPTVRFIQPCFADSLVTSMMTDNPLNVSNLTKDFINIKNSIVDHGLDRHRMGVSNRGYVQPQQPQQTFTPQPQHTPQAAPITTPNNFNADFDKW